MDPIHPKAVEAPASKTNRKSTGSNTIVPAPPSKPFSARTPPSKMAAAPRPKNVPAPSPITKTTKRMEVAPHDEDEEIEADENGTYGDSSRLWNAGNLVVSGNSLPWCFTSIVSRVH